MKLKEITRTAIQAWSPAQQHPIYLATGTSAQQLDASFSTSASLEIFQLDLADPSLDMKTSGTHTTPHRYHKMVWGPHGVGSDGLPSGVLITGGENGDIILYDAAKIIAGSSDVVIDQSTKHTGPVKGLDVNNFQSNLFASGGNESEIYIWDLNAFNTPMTPGPKTQPLEDVSCVAWNCQVQHILASASPSGRASIWDLRKNDLIIKVSDHSNRMHCSGLAWHPEVATQLVVASEDDRMPVIQMWDLRFATSPLKVLENHTRGVLAIAWSLADPELLLSCGKDNRILCWNPNTAEVLYELPTSTQWCFDIQWCPRNPAVLSAASFDGHISIYSIMGGGNDAVSHKQADTISTSFGNMDPFGTGQALPPLQIPQAAPTNATFTPLKKPPKWIRRPVGASFAFGGKLVSLENGTPPAQQQPSQQPSAPQRVVHVSQVVTETDFLERSAQLQATLSAGTFAEFCQAKIEAAPSEFEKAVWSFLKVNFEDDSRGKYLDLLGYKKEELALKIAEALEKKESQPEEAVPEPVECLDSQPDPEPEPETEPQPEAEPAPPQPEPEPIPPVMPAPELTFDFPADSFSVSEPIVLHQLHQPEVVPEPLPEPAVNLTFVPEPEIVPQPPVVDPVTLPEVQAEHVPVTEVELAPPEPETQAEAPIELADVQPLEPPSVETSSPLAGSLETAPEAAPLEQAFVPAPLGAFATAAVPEAFATAAVPEAFATAAVPEAFATAAVPEAFATAAVPEAFATAAVPEAFSALPDPCLQALTLDPTLQTIPLDSFPAAPAQLVPQTLAPVDLQNSVPVLAPPTDLMQQPVSLFTPPTELQQSVPLFAPPVGSLAPAPLFGALPGQQPPMDPGLLFTPGPLEAATAPPVAQNFGLAPFSDPFAHVLPPGSQLLGGECALQGGPPPVLDVGAGFALPPVPHLIPVPEPVPGVNIPPLPQPIRPPTGIPPLPNTIPAVHTTPLAIPDSTLPVGLPPVIPVPECIRGIGLSSPPEVPVADPSAPVPLQPVPGLVPGVAPMECQLPQVCDLTAPAEGASEVPVMQAPTSEPEPAPVPVPVPEPVHDPLGELQVAAALAPSAVDGALQEVAQEASPGAWEVEEDLELEPEPEPEPEPVLEAAVDPEMEMEKEEEVDEDPDVLLEETLEDPEEEEEEEAAATMELPEAAAAEPEPPAPAVEPPAPAAEPPALAAPVAPPAAPEPVLKVSKDVDGLITQALLTGDFESAVELCIHDNRMADSIILAIAGGPELLEKTQKKYFLKTQTKITKLISAVVTKDWLDILETCDVSNWREALAAVMTYAKPEEFASLCGLLGSRLEQAEELSLQAQACLCYICAGSLEKLVTCWTKAQESQSPLSLQDLVEKVVVLQQAVERTHGQQASAVGAALAQKMSQYASLLASQGSLDTALSYLPENTNQEVVEQLRDRLSRALGRQAAPAAAGAPQAAPAATPVQNAQPHHQPVPAATPAAPAYAFNPHSAQPSVPAPAPTAPQYYQPGRSASTVTSWSNQTPTALPSAPRPPLGPAPEPKADPGMSPFGHQPPVAVPPPASSAPAYISQQYPQMHHAAFPPAPPHYNAGVGAPPLYNPLQYSSTPPSHPPLPHSSSSPSSPSSAYPPHYMPPGAPYPPGPVAAYPSHPPPLHPQQPHHHHHHPPPLHPHSLPSPPAASVAPSFPSPPLASSASYTASAAASPLPPPPHAPAVGGGSYQPGGGAGSPVSPLPPPPHGASGTEQNAALPPASPTLPVPDTQQQHPDLVPASQRTGPQNGWNDPPNLTRGPSKKKKVLDNYTPPAPITAPIFSPLGEPQPPAGPPQPFQPGMQQQQQTPYNPLQQQTQPPPPQQQQHPQIPTTGPGMPHRNVEGAPGAPTGALIQPPQRTVVEKVSKKPIPEEHMVLKTTFEALVQKCLAAASDPQTKRKLDQANKRLELLYDKLREQSLSAAIVGGLHNMARSMETRAYAEGLSIHTHIVTSSNFSEISSFMPVLKVLLTEANKLGV